MDIQQIKSQFPAIITDIDGVLYSGSNLSGNSQEVISDILYQKFQSESGFISKIPFVLLTNGGMQTEHEKALALNKKLDLETYQKSRPERYPLVETNGPYLIQKEQIIMCHTQLGDQSFKDQYVRSNQESSNGFTVILLAGLRGNSQEILAQNYQLGPQNYITLEEFAIIYPEISRFVQHEIRHEQRQNNLKLNFLQRFGIDRENLEMIDQFKKTLKVNLIITLCWISQEGLAHQIFSDLLTSKDGNIFSQKRRTIIENGEIKVIDPQVVELIFTNDDIVYAEQWPKPRFGPGSFNICFKAIFKSIYGYEPEYKTLGKPTRECFEFAQRIIEKQAKEMGINEIYRFYMIGDSPFSDIEGAVRMSKLPNNDQKWKSILVKTGVYKEDPNQSLTPSQIYEKTQGAHYIVEGMIDAFNLIKNNEKLI